MLTIKRISSKTLNQAHIQIVHPTLHPLITALTTPLATVVTAPPPTTQAQISQTQVHSIVIHALLQIVTLSILQMRMMMKTTILKMMKPQALAKTSMIVQSQTTAPLLTHLKPNQIVTVVVVNKAATQSIRTIQVQKTLQTTMMMMMMRVEMPLQPTVNQVML